VPSVATVHRVLVRRGMVVAQPQKRPRSAWKRFEWPRPNDAWQIDATAWALADGRGVWIMDVLDDHSRALVAARVCSGPTAAAAWDAFIHASAEWGSPAHVMSDNGICFTARLHSKQGETDFERTLRAQGIVHIPSSPAHPQTCGKLERSHQTTKRWLTHVGLAATEAELQAQLDRWRLHYNRARPHSALGGRTPLERWLASPAAQPGEPLAGPRRASLHVVDSGGKIGWNTHLIALDSQLAGEQVLVIANDLHLVVHGRTGIIRELVVDPARRYQPSGVRRGRKTKS
jgi:transposase InsO family protein